MSWNLQLSSLPLKTKLAITVVGAGLAVLGLSTYLSFQYWQEEARAVAEQQALLAAVSTRASIEQALDRGNEAATQRTLHHLLRNPAVRSARVYDADGRIIFSARTEEVGQRIGKVWIPRARELPRDGIARLQELDHDHGVHAFVPLGGSMRDVLEIEFSLTSIENAMERGVRLGVGLLIASLLALAVILYAMLHREVVAPLHRAAMMLSDDQVPLSDAHALESGIAQLKQKGETAEKLAEQRRMMLEERAGFAEVGELAAEMAHEFKRPLAAIQTAIQLLEQEYTLGDDGQKLLVGIEGQLDRLSETMRDVFGLAKPISVEREDVNLHDVLDNALLQLAANIPTPLISIRREYGPDLPIVSGDARRLELAFLNVMNNAVDAMPNGGVLTIRVEPRKGVVDVAFMDTGCGMDPGDVQKVMKPFYSTKATGTGLGLPLVARIVSAHDGQVLMESEKGSGTTVRLRLPVRNNMQPEELTWAQHESSSSTTTTSSAR
ncbi:MAG TPA: ATP-binding protein [Longimicrobiales bacterium]